MTKIDGQMPKPGPNSDWYAKCDEIESVLDFTPRAGGQVQTVDMPRFRLSDRARQEIEAMQNDQRRRAATDTTTFD